MASTASFVCLGAASFPRLSSPPPEGSSRGPVLAINASMIALLCPAELREGSKPAGFADGPMPR